MRSPSTDRVEVPFSARFHSVRSGRNPDGTPVEGLRMVRSPDSHDSHSTDDPTRDDLTHQGGELGASFDHQPVMLSEVVEILVAAPAGVVLDATVGGAGHAVALLEAAPHLSLVGLDQDPAAVRAARARLERFGDRATVVGRRFDELGRVLDELGVPALTGFVFDLGVSSPQLDRAERGFSYRLEGELDMRMDPGRALGAPQVVNEWTEEDLTRLFRENGETRFARRIARSVLAGRPITTTTQLADIVKGAIPAPARRRGGHPARRVFQAVRIAVNEELSVLPAALDQAIERLATGGRGVVLSYHSGEDRIVKERFAWAATGGCVCPPGLPCVCGAQPTVRLLTRGARRPGGSEIETNRRAESARLRAVESVRPLTTAPTAVEAEP